MRLLMLLTLQGVSVTQCPAGQEYCCGTSTTVIGCGTVQAVPATAVAPAAGQANFGEYPWQVRSKHYNDLLKWIYLIR